MKRLDANLDRLWREYSHRVDDVALKYFNSHIRPYMAKKGYRFLAGNGTYYIEDANGKFIYTEDLPKRIQDVLEAYVPGMSSNCLGSLMPDFDGHRIVPEGED
jgi:hypothetical protein